MHPSLSPLSLNSPGLMPPTNLMMRGGPLTAPAELNNMGPPSTPTFLTPTSSGMQQHFSFSPGNLENMPPGMFQPPFHPQQPSSWHSPDMPFPEDKRLVVNARQRSRVQNMNDAFRMLKAKVPGLSEEDKTFSKLEVLQCTISYLKHLYSILDIDARQYKAIPEIQERVDHLENRFVINDGCNKKRGTKRGRAPTGGYMAPSY